MVCNKTSNYSYSTIFTGICLQLIRIQEIFVVVQSVLLWYVFDTGERTDANKWLERGLNLWPWDYESPALPLSYRAFYVILSECGFYSTLGLKKCFGEKCSRRPFITNNFTSHFRLNQLCSTCIYRTYDVSSTQHKNALMAEWLMQRAHNSSFFGTSLGSSPGRCICSNKLVYDSWYTAIKRGLSTHVFPRCYDKEKICCVHCDVEQHFFS